MAYTRNEGSLPEACVITDEDGNVRHLAVHVKLFGSWCSKKAGQRATVSVKGGHRHVIPLSPRMMAIIKAQPKICPQVFTYVCTRRAPKRKDRTPRIVGERYPFSKQGWNRQWQKALKDAGIEDYRFHDNRHTAATRNLRASGSLKAVSKLLGHASVTTTSRYAHALEDDVRAMLFATESRNTPEAPDVDHANNMEKRA